MRSHCADEKKGVYKGESFPLCTEEGAFPSSVVFVFFSFFFNLCLLGVIRGLAP